MMKVRATSLLSRPWRFAVPMLAAVIGLSVTAPRVHADSLLFWNFENAMSVGDVSTAVGAPGNPGIAGFASQTGGGPTEDFSWAGLGVVHLTRFFGTNYRYIQFTLTRPMYLQSVTFDHIHNHNSEFPTYANYNTQLQINTGSGFASLDNTASAIVDDSGSADSPDNNFCYDATLAGYIFNLSSKGLTTGT